MLQQLRGRFLGLSFRKKLEVFPWLAAGALALLLAAGAASGPASSAAATTPCAGTGPGPAAEARIRRALASGRDVWGAALLASPGGPTLAAARRLLPPLLLARGPQGAALTASGVYYLPFAQPEGPRGAGTVALHVADGSQVLAQRVGGRSLTVLVGPDGRERYGSCLARLVPARLAGGWLPVLRTGYGDAAGARYRQESFAARVPGTRALVSFLRLEVDARRASRAVTVRLVPSPPGLRRAGPALARAGLVHLAFGAGGLAGGTGVAYRVSAGSRRTVLAAWLATPSRLRGFRLDDAAYAEARRSAAAYWQGRLEEATQVRVPERAVQDALQALLVQSLTLTYRYSIGNPYEQFSFPESPDVARVLASWGLTPVARSILRTSLTRDETRYPSWKRGSRLLAFADYTRLSGDVAALRSATPALRRFVDGLDRSLRASGRSLLARERYSSDIPDLVYGFHAQAVAWEGLRAIAGVWRETGRPALAVRAAAVARRLGGGLRRAIAASQRRLPDGSLFVPARLLDGERPYRLLVEERLGSYWNLVVPYALASGILPPGSPQARGVLRYLERHGSRLLGIVRAGAYALYGRDAYPASGTNHVYNTSLARFLADNDRADELVLSLYGGLAAGMTPRTYVSGEAASVAPLPGTARRAMYLPPNSASSAAFLATLRLLLLHETRDGEGRPRGLRLAYATPRDWLRAGRTIAVREAPTSFGPVSYTIAARASTVTVELEPPPRRPAFLGLRLRLPRGARLGRVEVGGAASARVDRSTGTIDLSGLDGPITLVAHVSR